MLFCEHEGTLTSSVSLCIGLWGRHREGGDQGPGTEEEEQEAEHLTPSGTTHSGCVSVK